MDFVSESAIVNACMKWLLLHGCYCWRNNSGAYKPEGTSRFIRYGLRGSADILGITPSGRFIAVECKQKGNKQTEYQIEFQERITQKSGIYIVAYGTDDLESHKALIR